MRFRAVPVLILVSLIIFSCCNRKSNNQNSSIGFLSHENEKKIDVLADGSFFTSLYWPDNVYKPILWPVLTSSGTEITRGFPLKPREGERNDHIHQVGIWFNYGNVNGIDFWGNGSRGIKEPGGGEIKHLRIERLSSRKGTGTLVSVESWVNPAGMELLSERTEYHFIAKNNIRIIDRITTLTAGDTTVFFKDTKEGMFAIRIARQLELPSKDGITLIDAHGNPSAAKDTLNSGVNGSYRSSEGLTNDEVWGTRAKWMDLDGNIGDKKISVVICDHPKNPGYPTYWHARGYGLFSANPLGWEDFTMGKEEFGFNIPAKKSAKFRYRVIINSGTHLTDNEINMFSDEFSKKYRK